ncbi:MAG TPA: replication initiator protein A [Gemmatimonadaceae bacterium]|nr:replication initiator protein A [Gemmatimonadaceae bacterium]
MTSAPRKRLPSRGILFDRALEALPLFRLSDSSDDGAISFEVEAGGRWRVIPLPGDRLPGTFDQDVYFEIFRRYQDAGAPADGTVAFTLHDFLRSMGRKVDGRTYEQLRAALGRLQRTTLESAGAYWDAAENAHSNARFSLLSSIRIERRRSVDREQLGLFAVLAANEPGDARVTIGAPVRANIAAGYTVRLAVTEWLSLSSPVSRRLYRMIAVVRAQNLTEWTLPLATLAEQLPLAQRYPSHLQRVLQPAHEMLVAAGAVATADISQHQGTWIVRYVLPRTAP